MQLAEVLLWQRNKSPGQCYILWGSKGVERKRGAGWSKQALGLSVDDCVRR